MNRFVLILALAFCLPLAAQTDDAALHAQVAHLRTLVTEKLTELRDTIVLRRSKRQAASMDLMNSGRGAVLMESIRESARQTWCRLCRSAESRWPSAR